MASEKTTYKDWELFKQSLLKELPVPDENEGEKQRRIKKLEGHFEEWKKFYFSKYASAPTPAYHKRSSRKFMKNKRIYMVRPWSREMAKDALTMMEVINLALTGQIKTVLFISATNDSAENLLKPYKLSFEHNQRIINDYAEQRSFEWSDSHFIAKCGCSFFAFGAGQSPRGTRDEEIRPDVIIFSDIDTDEEARNPERIKTKWEKIEQAIIPTVSISSNVRILFLGNIIGKDTCITRAMKFADHYEIINIRDKNGKSSWPEKNKEHQIDWLLSKMSWASSQKEYFNNPVQEGTTFKDLRWGKVPPLNKFPFLLNYGDPAPSNSENKKSSHKAVVLLGMLDEKLYVINCYLEQCRNSKFVGWFWDLIDYIKGKNSVYHYLENNSLQNPFYEQVLVPLFESESKIRKNPIYPSSDVRSKPDKFFRIEAELEPLHRLGKLIFNEKEKNNPHMMRLVEQFEAVEPTLSANVDGPDAVEGGYWVIKNKLIVLKKDDFEMSQRSGSGNRY